MTIALWSPFAELDSVERRMRRFFGEAGFVPAVLPAADVYETDEDFVVELEVPGFAEKQLLIKVSDHTLTVKGARTEVKTEEQKAFRLHERLAKEFERRFTLPSEADTGLVTAEFDKGVLAIHVAKAKELTPRTIEIAAKN
jgi:HSP20 family protein